MATLSLTLPISCQICLGKVKDPAICSNNHAFCTVCLDVWLQNNDYCPTCRVDITKDKPYRKVIGSTENSETSSLHIRMQLRRTRLQLLEKEYETEFQNLSDQLNLMTTENEKLKKELQSGKQVPGEKPVLVSKNAEAFSNLTKKLQEISSTYDDVRRDMTVLQEEKEKLQQENSNLKKEISKLKEDSMFTKSPKRYEKFTITGLKAKVEQYEKENQQLKKALQTSDKYVEELQSELNALKSECTTNSLCEMDAQVTPRDDDTTDVRAETVQTEAVSISMAAVSSNDQFDKTASSNACNSIDFQTSTVTTPSVRTQSRSNESCHSPHSTAVLTTTPSTARDLFPATKKLLALKKIHENRPPTSQIQNDHHDIVPAIDLPWPSHISCVSYNSSNGEERSTPLSQTRSEESSGQFSHSFSEVESECCSSTSSNVILTAAGPWTLPSSEETNFSSPKRINSISEPFILNKKIKVEKE